MEMVAAQHAEGICSVLGGMSLENDQDLITEIGCRDCFRGSLGLGQSAIDSWLATISYSSYWPCSTMALSSCA